LFFLIGKRFSLRFVSTPNDRGELFKNGLRRECYSAGSPELSQLCRDPVKVVGELKRSSGSHEQGARVRGPGQL
jgi:hypothetical protein